MLQEVKWNLAAVRKKPGLQKFITSQRHAGFPLFLPLRPLSVAVGGICC